jgi:LAS superfamily LD-carboxypeptidase LdcB
MLKPETLNAFENFCEEAKEYGFEPKIESGFRSFDRQLLIWNEKVSGKRKVLDKNGKPLNIAELSEAELMKTILLWSALPGTSRHEWGTDMDVIDSAAVPEDYEAELTIEESYGVFGKFHKWLDIQIGNKNYFGFKRVFLPGVGRVQPEPWHLTFSSESREIERNFTAKNLAERLSGSGILLLPQILANLDWILENHVFCYFEK